MTEPTRASAVARSLALLGYAMGALARRRSKNLALGGGLTLAVALVAAVLFLADALRAEAERGRAAMPDVTVERLVAGRPSILPRAAGDAIRGLSSVDRVVPRVWGYLFLPTLEGNVTIVGTPRGAPGLSAASGSLSSGRDLAVGAHEMLVGSGLASLLGLSLGDRLGLPSPNPEAAPLKLVGTFSSSVDLFTSDVVVCDEDDARALLSLASEEATDLAVWLKNPNEAHVVATKVMKAIPGARVIEKGLLARLYALTYGRRSGLVLAAAIPALFALLVLAWDRASGLGPEERHEIAILKAVGWSTRDVLAAKMVEALFVALFASSLGLVLAYLWVFPLGAPGLRPSLAGWSVLYPIAPLTPEVDLTQLLSVALAVVAPFVALSIVPAWRAATTDPMETMRG